MITLRREEPSDHRAVELLTRDAFWGSEIPRCVEPLLVRRLRGAASLVPELNLVAEDDGVIVGHVIYTRARVVGPDGEAEVLTFGPLSVQPAAQGTGVGSALMRHTLGGATELGHRAVVVYGHPGYYPRFGFVRGADVGVTAPGGATFDGLMALALVPGGLDGVRGEFHEDPVFQVDPAEADAFDLAEYPPKEPAELTPLEALAGTVPDDVVAALGAAGFPNVQMVRRTSHRELAAVPGVGESGRDAIAAFLHARGLAW